MAEESTNTAAAYAAFYGEHYERLCALMEEIGGVIDRFREDASGGLDRDPIEHLKMRIKSPQSMKEKLEGRGLAPTCENALTEVTDVIGLRTVCTFVSDVYNCLDVLKAMPGFSVYKDKDYIRNPKPNGYRSYHLILQHEETGYYAEIQLRTIAMDCWASLEHQMRYKKGIANTKILEKELKRCADEIASTDLSLETIRQLIQEAPVQTD